MESGGKPEGKPYPFPLVPFGPFHKETSILRTLKIMPSTLNKIVLS
jgi:hypothetical protein